MISKDPIAQALAKEREDRKAEHKDMMNKFTELIGILRQPQAPPPASPASPDASPAGRGPAPSPPTGLFPGPASADAAASPVQYQRHLATQTVATASGAYLYAQQHLDLIREILVLSNRWAVRSE